MSHMADILAGLCGNCDKEPETCGKDMDECLAAHEADLINSAYEKGRDYS